MHCITVLPCRLVLSKCLIIGTTPDAKVIDFGCTDHFGIAEVKCPYTKHHVTPLDQHRSNLFYGKDK